MNLQLAQPASVLAAGGKPSTWFPPGRLVEQSGVKEEGIYRKTTRRKQREKATRRGSRNRQEQNKTWQIKAREGQAKTRREDVRRQRGWDRERPEGWNHCSTKQAELQRTEDKTTIQYNTTTRIYNHKLKAQKSCAAHKHIKKRRTTINFGTSF